jgi:hypothetical protein
MATAYVGATSGASTDAVTDTSITTTVASSTTGYVNFCWINLTNGTASVPTVTPPSGWTQIGTTTDGASPTLYAGLWYRIVQGGDTTTPVWSFTTGVNAVWSMVAYSGLDSTTPYTNGDVGPYTGSTATKVTDSVTTTADGWIVSGFGDRAKGIYSALTDTSRTTSRLSVYANACSQVIQDSNADVTAGAQTRTVQGPSGTSVGSSFILRLNPSSSTSGSANPAQADGVGVAYAATVTATGSGTNATASAGAGTGTAYDVHALHSPLKEWMRDQGTMYVAHRGGSADWVEMTADAYQHVDALHVQAIEISAWRSSDGVWVGSHDQTTTRMFGTNLDIPSSTYAALSALRTTSGNFPIAKMIDLLDLYAGGNHIIFIDNKQNANVAEFLGILNGYANATGIFVVKQYYSGSATAVAARLQGYTTWGYYYDVDLANLDATEPKYDILGLNYDASSANWAIVKAKGKPVLAHVALTASQAATGLSQGADGVVTGKILGVVPNAGATLPSATGVAYDASVVILGSGSAGALEALATGQAFDAAAQASATSATPDAPNGTAVAFDATVVTFLFQTIVYFTTPVVKERWPIRHHGLWSRMHTDRGQSILRYGSQVKAITTPSVNDMETADAVYIGGRIYAITHDEADLLRAAGYGHWLSDDPHTPIPEIDYSQYGVGVYGTGPYGD